MPISGPSSSRATDYTDDLRLAHVLADDADSLTQARYRALDEGQRVEFEVSQGDKGPQAEQVRPL